MQRLTLCRRLIGSRITVFVFHETNAAEAETVYCQRNEDYNANACFRTGREVGGVGGGGAELESCLLYTSDAADER